MERAKLFLLPLLAAGTLVATAACCSRATDSPSCATPPAPGPTGTVWPEGWAFRATAITEDGARKALVAGTQLRILVEYAYHLQVTAGCDHMVVDGSAEKGVFTLIGVDGVTQDRAPDLVAQDTWIRQFLGDSPQWTRKDGNLTLRTARAEIDLVAEPLPTFTDSCGWSFACAGA